MYSEWFNSFISLASISLFLLLVLIVLYTCYPKRFLKHPNKLYYYALIYEAVSNALILIQLIIIHEDNYEELKRHSRALIFLSLLQIYTYLVYYHYILALNLEILLKISKTLSPIYMKRVILYHVFAIAISTIITIILFAESDFGNKNFIESTQKLSPLTSFAIYYIYATSIVIAICIIILVIKGVAIKTRDSLNLIIASFIIVSTTFVIVSLQFIKKDFNSDHLNILFLFILTSSGILEFFILIRNKKILKTIKQIFRRDSSKKERMTEEFTILVDNYKSHSHFGGLLSDMFDDLTKNCLINIFTAISLRFITAEKNCMKKTVKYTFNSEDLNRLNEKVNMALIEKFPIKHITLLEFQPEVFKDIRDKCKCENLVASLLDHNNYIKLVNLSFEQGGRSDSFVFSTADNKFVIKTIKKNELNVFLKKLLKNYSNRVIEAPNSKLVRFLGAFKILPMKQSVIIMENILYDKENSVIFDLKGSRLDRIVKGIENPLEPPLGTVLKDINFELFAFQFNLEPSFTIELVSTLKADFEILMKSGIMDYSILLGISKLKKTKNFNRFTFTNKNQDIISIGVIDLFQEYNFGKASEKRVKAVFNKTKDISSMDPKNYFYRICAFLDKIIEVSY